MKTTDKESINRLVEICIQNDIEDVIFSPGSRNAPLVIAFHAAESFLIKTIPDERVAAFYAMGQAIATGKPSIICCTSGSAVLNYAPAIVESYYQRVPLIILTADRPSDKIDQGVGQSMRQNDVFANYIKRSFTWIEEASTDTDLFKNDQIISKAITLALENPPGPVHINIPFKEPLYDKIEYQKPIIPKSSTSLSRDKYPQSEIESFQNEWRESERKVVICGLMPANTEIGRLLAELSESRDIVLLTETTSNIQSKNAVQSLDRVLHGMENPLGYKADLLLSLGGPIVSKKIKQYFHQNKPRKHYFLDQGPLQDTYETNPTHLQKEVIAVLIELVSLASRNDLQFQNLWERLQSRTSRIHSEFVTTAPYSDLTVFSTILAMTPANTEVHLANSTPVRYAQLFDQSGNHSYYSNRGVSGIDGSTSTALGFASKSINRNLLITGDMSFFYDSNAFWQKDLPKLLVILINNGGGGIFRYIPGPDTTGQLESVFESSHNLNASHLCQMHDLNYLSASNIHELEFAMNSYYNKLDSITIIEVFTPREENAEVLKSYFMAMQ